MVTKTSKKERSDRAIAVIVLVFFGFLMWYLVNGYQSNKVEIEEPEILTLEAAKSSLEEFELNFETTEAENAPDREENIQYYAVDAGLKSVILKKIENENHNPAEEALVLMEEKTDTTSLTLLDRELDTILETSLDSSDSKIREEGGSVAKEIIEPSSKIDTSDIISTPKTPSTQTINSCRIVVGAFKNSSNVAKLERRLASAGYKTERRKKAELLLMTVVPNSCEETKLFAELKSIKKGFLNDAYILHDTEF